MKPGIILIRKIDYDMEKPKELQDAGFRWDENGKLYYPKTMFPWNTWTVVMGWILQLLV